MAEIETNDFFPWSIRCPMYIIKRWRCQHLAIATIDIWLSGHYQASEATSQQSTHALQNRKSRDKTNQISISLSTILILEKF